MKREANELAELDRKNEYPETTAEELERRLRETFFCPDEIDETVYRELEELMAALDRIQPLEIEADPEEDWQRFLKERGEELRELFTPEDPEPAKPRARASRPLPLPALLRRALIAAAVVVLLAGAALAAGPRLWAWVPGNAGDLRFEVVDETVPRAAILTALEQLDIHEPVYPGKLPEGFLPMESQLCEDPFILFEQYGDGKRYLSITVIPASSFETAVYQEKNETIREYRSGNVVHYLFNNVGAITAVWYTENYFTSISGNISIAEMMRIIDTVYAR